MNKDASSLPRLAFWGVRRAVPATTGPELAASGHPTCTPRFQRRPWSWRDISSRARCITRAYAASQPWFSSHSLQLALPLSVLLVFAPGPRTAGPAMGAKNVVVAGSARARRHGALEWGLLSEDTPMHPAKASLPAKIGPDAAAPLDTFRGKISPGRRDRPRRRQPRPTTHTRETPKRCKSPLQTPMSQHPAAAIPSATTDPFPGSAPSPPRPVRRQQQQR